MRSNWRNMLTRYVSPSVAIDNILSGLNDVLNGLVVALGGIVGGLLDALNLKLTQGYLSLTYVRVPVLGGLL